MKFTLFTLLLSVSTSLCSNFEDFAASLAQVESSNNPKAYNSKEIAIGIYQIRPGYFKDAREFDRDLAKYKHSDCYNPLVAKRVIYSYFARYESKALKNGDWEALARAHNGGCGWRTKTGKVKSNLDNYWTKVSKNLK